VRLLLDTHTLLWWFSGDPSLPASARKIIAHRDSSVFVSSVSAWEIATKVRLGRLSIASDLARDFRSYIARESFEALGISVEHGIRAGSLPGPLRDPFDRMLIAQAQIEELVIASNESIFDGYGVQRLW
jgi:PIN domain nuclease of toxin-antitoxin system